MLKQYFKNNVHCVITDIIPEDIFCTNFCEVDIRNYNGYCDPQTFACVYDQEDCDLDGTYCVDDSIETRDYFCTPDQCQFDITSTEICLSDGWYNFGNVPGLDDPTCENRDYFCQDSGLNDFCTFNVIKSFSLKV